jgi:nucleoside-diphosphate-sugar epimerase
MNSEQILITGANGQLGTVLAQRLISIYGSDKVIVTDINTPNVDYVHFELLDVMNKKAVDEIIQKYKITQVFHLAAILSATGEKIPMKCWQVNVDGYLNILESCRRFGVKKIFYPSTIAVFGSDAQKIKAPQNSALNPSTVYGISKVSGEQWSAYYFNRYGMDIRSVRYPGVIGYQSLPGGGTTDYAVEIFHEALKHQAYDCFLSSNTCLPMIYMEDVINATIQVMEAPKEQITVRTSYNLEGANFTPAELSKEIKKYIPEFEITYSPDERQAIADSWVNSLDDSPARHDWNWAPVYTLPEMTKDMIDNLRNMGVGNSKKKLIKEI